MFWLLQEELIMRIQVRITQMLEGKNAHYLILKGLEAGWLYLIEEKVDNGKLMAGPDKPWLIFKNNLWD